MKQNPCRYCALSYEYKGKHYQGSKECRQCENIKKHKEYLKSHRKFEVGEPIKTLDELLEQEWVIWGYKTTHIEVIKSLQLRLVLRLLENNSICKAIKKNMEE